MSAWGPLGPKSSRPYKVATSRHTHEDRSVHRACRKLLPPHPSPVPAGGGGGGEKTPGSPPPRTAEVLGNSSFRPPTTLRVCLLGNRTLARRGFDVCAKMHVVGNGSAPTALWGLFCNGSSQSLACNEYFTLNNLSEIQGIPGVASGVLLGKCGGGCGTHLAKPLGSPSTGQPPGAPVQVSSIVRTGPLSHWIR